MSKNDIHKIRPAGRHLLTIGRDLIQDQYAAVIELVKNAYDADSPEVNITFKISHDRNKLTIIIEDHGHGMSRDTVINNWLVPSTDYKLKERTRYDGTIIPENESPNGRKMQGRKGVGRYASSILGNDLLLETVTESGESTTVMVEWSDFEKAAFLHDVEILVETKKTKLSSGTTLTIAAGKKHIDEWNEVQIKKLKNELKKLMSPVIKETIHKNKGFDIFLTFNNFYEDHNENIKTNIEPYRIVELYDYRIHGKIKPDGKGKLIYENQKAKNTVDEKIEFTFPEKTGCGELDIDIRVYDRESAAIDLLIKRGLKDDNGDYLGKAETKRLLNDNNGIGVYRNGFRIRPLGDADFDWLTLNQARIQNPSLKIGDNQVIGYIQIESEEKSHLEEKSARDGLRENKAYVNLKKIAKKAIEELETRRFAYRKKEGLSRPVIKLEKELEKLFTYDDVKKNIEHQLKKLGADENATDSIIKVINDKEEENNKLADDIKRVVAVYQGQATLGKIINVVMHEGRRPLSYISNQIVNFQIWKNELEKTKNLKILDEIIPITEGLGVNSDIFVKLFKKLDPLAAGKRPNKKKFDIAKTFLSSFVVFENELLENQIKFSINIEKDVNFHGWESDIYLIMTNLIDNSIYWMVEKNIKKKNISITIDTDNGEFISMDYKDTGPGIEEHLFEGNIIFEPEFSTKISGTGLGLAIAGEASTRNNLELKCLENNNGAYFRLQLLEE